MTREDVLKMKVLQDGILVKAEKPPKVLKGLYVTQKTAERLKKERCAWLATILKMGPKVDFKDVVNGEEVKEGAVVVLGHESKDCPAWEFPQDDGDEERLVLVKDDDVLAIQELETASTNGNH